MSLTSATEHNRNIVETAFNKWKETGTGFFGEVLSPNVIWTIKGSGPSAGTFNGRDIFVERALRPFASRMSTEVRPNSVRVWADGDYVIVNFDGEGVAGDGIPYRNSYVWIIRMRDGKAVEVDAFLDLTLYDEVLRRVPLPPVSEKRP
ncbi:nuclear transport factor 2 family protein [Escherichia coli]|nr:nuclear transport factor 2 family protein [Escherichia coli]